MKLGKKGKEKMIYRWHSLNNPHHAKSYAKAWSLLRAAAGISGWKLSQPYFVFSSGTHIRDQAHHRGKKFDNHSQRLDFLMPKIPKDAPGPKTPCVGASDGFGNYGRRLGRAGLEGIRRTASTHRIHIVQRGLAVTKPTWEMVGLKDGLRLSEAGKTLGPDTRIQPSSLTSGQSWGLPRWRRDEVFNGRRMEHENLALHTRSSSTVIK
ncbi:hypothetical protein F4806DRAFT_90762 [Annulohypoxylon nitens]|nr:hypothetical protein F4806DRAFT_90762 [Annulohypoxylon nitens]